MARFPVKREDQCQNLVLFFFPRKGWISCWQKFRVAVVHLDHPFSQQNKLSEIQIFFWQGENSPMRECEVSGGQKNRRETLRSDCQECGQTTKDGRTGLCQKKVQKPNRCTGCHRFPKTGKNLDKTTCACKMHQVFIWRGIYDFTAFVDLQFVPEKELTKYFFVVFGSCSNLNSLYLILFFFLLLRRTAPVMGSRAPWQVPPAVDALPSRQTAAVAGCLKGHLEIWQKIECWKILLIFENNLIAFDAYFIWENGSYFNLDFSSITASWICHRGKRNNWIKSFKYLTILLSE